MPKPVCVSCRRFYRPHKNGIHILEGKPRNGERHIEPGTSEEENWIPYKVWQADLWKCQGCDHELIYGFGLNPISQDYRDGFKIEVERCTHKVNDC